MISLFEVFCIFTSITLIWKITIGSTGIIPSFLTSLIETATEKKDETAGSVQTGFFIIRVIFKTADTPLLTRLS